MVRVLLCVTLLLSGIAPLFAQAPAAGQRFALLVGVRKYDKTQLTSLQYSEADVTELAALLKQSGYAPKNVVLLTQSLGAEEPRFLPTTARIREELKLLLSTLEPADSVLVAFAGHGVTFKGEKGSYFCPMDATLDERATLIPLDEVYAALEKCPARGRSLLVDACRNEITTQLQRAAGVVELEAVGKPQAVPLPQGVAALFSCSPGQYAFEHPDLKHGVFFHYVLQGLKGKADFDQDGAVSLNELDIYTRREVQQFVRVELGKLQSPQLVSTKLEGVPVLVRVPRPAPPLAIAPFDAATAKKHQQAWAAYLRLEPVTTNRVNMKLALIPPGEFLMGAPENEIGRFEYEPQHRVRITKAYYLGQTEVTVGQFRAFVTDTKYKTEAERGVATAWGYNPETDLGVASNRTYSWMHTGYTMTDEHPVSNISWNDAQAYCDWLSRKEGKLYRLPTEAEWEFACRAGTTTPFHFGGELNGDKANVNGKYPYGTTTKGPYRKGTTPVGSFAPNSFGLYDMHGNLWEWCQDWYGEKYYEKLLAATTEDPTGDDSKKSERVSRGGAWFNNATFARSSRRHTFAPFVRPTGFRVARNP